MKLLQVTNQGRVLSSANSLFLLLSLVVLLDSVRGEAKPEIQPKSMDAKKLPKAMDEKSFIQVSKKPQNVTKHMYLSHKFYCDITGKPPPTYTWFKNDIPVKQDDKRIFIKSKYFGSTLRIKRLQMLDEGLYRCVAENPSGRKNVSAYLKVIPELKPGREFKNDRLPPKPVDRWGLENPVEEKPGGYCQLFTSNVCKKFLGKERVYVSHRLLQAKREETIARFIEKVTLELEDKVCNQKIVEATCYYNFPLCSVYNGVEVPQKLCREDCEILTKEKCRNQFKSILRLSSEPAMRKIILNCSTLPSAQEYGGSRCNNKRVQSSLRNCYNGSGEHYHGWTQESKSGKKCMIWQEMKGYKYLGSVNYCRNPLPKEMKSPWCFVTKDGERELCNIPLCKDTQSSPPLSTDYVPMFISLGVLTLIVAILVFFCCFWRRNNGTRGYKGIKKSQRPSNSELQATTAKIPVAAPNFQLSNIRFGEEIGRGLFGSVYRGDLIGLYGDNAPTPVAIKTLQSGAANKLQNDFRREANLMSELSHPNILCLLGVSMTVPPWCMLFELMPHGDLHEFLLYHSPTCETSLYAGDLTEEKEMGTPLTYAEKLHIATQVAAGMEYLSSRHFVHRDIAARNILVGENLLCKISDFGLSRELYSCDYYRVQSNSLLPVRWMPPEAILYGKFTVESDVWAYGVLMWEIWSYGLQPYYGYTNSEVIDLVRARQVLPCPEECPARAYSLMVDCWHELASHRPSFKDIHARMRGWQNEAVLQNAPPAPTAPPSHSGGSGQTNSTGLSDRPASQRIIPVPMPSLPPLPPNCKGPSPPPSTLSGGSSGHHSARSVGLVSPPPPPPPPNGSVFLPAEHSQIV